MKFAIDLVRDTSPVSMAPYSKPSELSSFTCSWMNGVLSIPKEDFFLFMVDDDMMLSNRARGSTTGNKIKEIQRLNEC